MTGCCIEILVEREALPRVRVADAGLAGGAAQAHRRLGRGDDAGREQLVEVAESPDQATLLAEIGRARAGRVSGLPAEGIGVPTIGTEARGLRRRLICQGPGARRRQSTSGIQSREKAVLANMGRS